MALALVGYGGKQKDASYADPMVRSFAGTNPAANNEISETVPAGKLWLLISVTVSLVETVQTPWPALVLTDGTTAFFKSLAGTAAMAATNTSQITWGPGLIALGGASDTTRQGSIPEECYLPEGYKITTVTSGLGANCDYGAPQILVLEYS